MTKKPVKKATKTAAKKPAAKKAVAKKPAAKKAVAKKPAVKRTAPANSKFNAPLTPSPELAAVIGAAPLARTEAVSKIWVYIKKNKLQNEANKREIIADDKLKPIFGKPKATMFELSKFLAAHLKS